MVKKVDVQETIEQPQIYIFARCPGSTELTAYTSTRMEDLDELQTAIVFDKAVMRFWAFMSNRVGQQKGGNYFCWICGISHHILLTLHMLHIEIIFPWMNVSRKF